MLVRRITQLERFGSAPPECPRGIHLAAFAGHWNGGVASHVPEHGGPILRLVTDRLNVQRCFRELPARDFA